MSGHFKHPHPRRTELNHITLDNLLVDSRYPVGVIRRADNLTAPLRLESFIPSGMIKVVMGI
jgi:hypothetical protein